MERAAEYSVFAKGRSKRYQIIYHPFEFVFTHAINFYSNYHANFHLDYLGRPAGKAIRDLPLAPGLGETKYCEGKNKL